MGHQLKVPRYAIRALVLLLVACLVTVTLLSLLLSGVIHFHTTTTTYQTGTSTGPTSAPRSSTTTVDWSNWVIAGITLAGLGVTIWQAKSNRQKAVAQVTYDPDPHGYL